MTKAFLFGAVVMPILMMGLFIVVIPLLMESNDKPLEGTVVVVAPEDVFQSIQDHIAEDSSPLKEIVGTLPDQIANDPLASALLGTNTNSELTIIPAPDGVAIDELKQRVRDGEYTGLIVVPESFVLSIESDKPLEVFIPSNFSPNHTDALTYATSKSVVDVRLRRLGHDPDHMRELTKRPRIIATRLSDDGSEAKDNEIARKLIPMAFMILLWIATFTSGNYLLTTTIEEKGNKVMEVLLSAISPMQLLGGKILGQAGVSAVILCMYGSAAMAGLVAFAMLDLIPMSHLFLFGIYFILAYFMVATIMAAVGSAVSELRLISRIEKS